MELWTMCNTTTGSNYKRVVEDVCKTWLVACHVAVFFPKSGGEGKLIKFVMSLNSISLALTPSQKSDTGTTHPWHAATTHVVPVRWHARRTIFDIGFVPVFVWQQRSSNRCRMSMNLPAKISADYNTYLYVRHIKRRITYVLNWSMIWHRFRCDITHWVTWCSAE